MAGGSSPAHEANLVRMNLAASPPRRLGAELGAARQGEDPGGAGPAQPDDVHGVEQHLPNRPAWPVRQVLFS